MTEKKKPKEKPTVVEMTKTQKELFAKERNEINQILGELRNWMVNHSLATRVDDFIKELNINVREEDWEFDAEGLRFIKRVK